MLIHFESERQRQDRAMKIALAARKRHIANAREWRRRWTEALEGGLGDAEAIFSVYKHELKLAHVDYA